MKYNIQPVGGILLFTSVFFHISFQNVNEHMADYIYVTCEILVNNVLVCVFYAPQLSDFAKLRELPWLLNNLILTSPSSTECKSVIMTTFFLHQ